MKTILTAVFLLISQSVFAQLYPVLHDADDLPIGNVVSIGEIGIQNFEYVDMVSLKGYRAKMAYHTAPLLNPQPEGTDRPGFGANAYFESSDCTGDPLMLPSWVRRSEIYIRPDLSNVWDSIQIAKLQMAGITAYKNGDLLEYNGVGYYVPFDAVSTSFETKSVRLNPSFCLLLDRCNLDMWQSYTQLLNFGAAEECPDITSPDPLRISTPRFMATGFTFSSLLTNDPVATGFQNIKYKQPYRIKYSDINTILKNGFEAQTE